MEFVFVFQGRGVKVADPVIIDQSALEWIIIPEALSGCSDLKIELSAVTQNRDNCIFLFGLKELRFCLPQDLFRPGDRIEAVEFVKPVLHRGSVDLEEDISGHQIFLGFSSLAYHDLTVQIFDTALEKILPVKVPHHMLPVLNKYMRVSGLGGGAGDGTDIFLIGIGGQDLRDRGKEHTVPVRFGKLYIWRVVFVCIPESKECKELYSAVIDVKIESIFILKADAQVVSLGK